MSKGIEVKTTKEIKEALSLQPQFKAKPETEKNEKLKDEDSDIYNTYPPFIAFFVKMALQLSRFHYITLSFNISAVYIALGLLISLQPPFFPSEAEKMGATPAEYGFVFGIANLSLFIFSPVFGKYGPVIGPKLCFNLGAVLQGVSGFLFAFLPYCTTTGSFIGLAYLLRALEGLGKKYFYLYFYGQHTANR